MNTGRLATEKLNKSFIASGHLQEINPEEITVKRKGADTVEASHDALLLNEALHTAQNAPDIRKEKVAHLRSLLEAGLYAIDNRQLARDLLREEAGLFSN